MINNNILANRLNQTRQGLSPDTETPEEFSDPLNSSDVLSEEKEEDHKLDLNKFNTAQLAGYLMGNSVINAIKFSVMSIIFGAAGNIILNGGLPFREFVIVGMAFSIIASGIYNIFKQKT